MKLQEIFYLNINTKVVIIVSPHTNWMDFYLELFIRGAINFKSNYLAKKSV